jgi:hypothetical protein
MAEGIPGPASAYGAGGCRNQGMVAGAGLVVVDQQQGQSKAPRRIHRARREQHSKGRFGIATSRVRLRPNQGGGCLLLLPPAGRTLSTAAAGSIQPPALISSRILAIECREFSFESSIRLSAFSSCLLELEYRKVHATGDDGGGGFTAARAAAAAAAGKEGAPPGTGC